MEELTTLPNNVKRNHESLPNSDSGKLNDGKKKVRYVQDIDEGDEEEDEYAQERIKAKSVSQPEVSIGGVPVHMVVDLGASTNVIDKNLWSKLKQEEIMCLRRVTRSFILMVVNSQ